MPGSIFSIAEKICPILSAIKSKKLTLLPAVKDAKGVDLLLIFYDESTDFNNIHIAADEVKDRQSIDRAGEKVAENGIFNRLLVRRGMARQQLHIMAYHIMLSWLVEIPYNVAGNAMACVELNHLIEILASEAVVALRSKAAAVLLDVNKGLGKVIQHANKGDGVLPYEVDCESRRRCCVLGFVCCSNFLFINNKRIINS